ncbi:hypothetical protein CCACVL1_05866, partial [Corchorus capsularis]
MAVLESEAAGDWATGHNSIKSK